MYMYMYMYMYMCVYTAVFDEVDLNLSMHMHGLCMYIIRTLIVHVLNTMTVRDFRITCSAAINTDMNREKDL